MHSLSSHFSSEVTRITSALSVSRPHLVAKEAGNTTHLPRKVGNWLWWTHFSPCRGNAQNPLNWPILSQFIQELSVWRASAGLLQDSFWRTARRCALSHNRDKKETLGEWEGWISKLCVQGAAEDGGIQEEYHTADVTEDCLRWYVSHCAYSLVRASQCDFVPTQHLTLIWLWHVRQCASLCLVGGKLRLRATQPISSKHVKH